jgi:hypothetical protein
MKTELTNYEIFPKMVPSGEITEITVRPMGAHVEFCEDIEYTIRFLPMTESIEPEPENEYESIGTRPCGGVLRFAHAFPGEQEHYVRILKPGEPQECVVTLSVYSLLPDLYSRRPYRGDFHAHSCRSDGREGPAVAAANYRKAGYDFMAVTDHGQWQPSEEAIAAWADQPIDIKLFHGEEVHTPGNHIHIINFGGDNSANALARSNEEQYRADVEAIVASLPALPDGVNPFEYAACLWSIGKIRAGGGMSIYCHPHWIANVYHVRDAMTWHVFENMPFDAFELLGGQTVQENNMQVALYNEARARGLTIPIVGASDSQGTVNANWFNWTSTVVFAPDSSREAIINAVKDGYSAALEHEPGEQPRAHGTYRMASYAMFLLRDYFPLHDELCFEEGRAMKGWLCGEQDAREILSLLKGRTQRLLDRCFTK